MLQAFCSHKHPFSNFVKKSGSSEAVDFGRGPDARQGGGGNLDCPRILKNSSHTFPPYEKLYIVRQFSAQQRRVFVSENIGSSVICQSGHGRVCLNIMRSVVGESV